MSYQSIKEAVSFGKILNYAEFLNTDSPYVLPNMEQIFRNWLKIQLSGGFAPVSLKNTFKRTNTLVKIDREIRNKFVTKNG